MDAGKEWDNKMSSHINTVHSGGVQHLESLLEEIALYKYDTVSQIIGAINNRIDILKKKGSASE